MTGDPNNIAPQKNRMSSDPKLTSQESIIDSKNLFFDKREVIINHNDQFYRLKITKQNKLILHK